jgi:hypothetical protein
MRDYKKINLMMIFVCYAILISNMWGDEVSAETAHYVFNIFFLFAILIKFLNDKIGYYILIFLLAVIILHRIFIHS